jgi:hypothetical protein
VLAAFVTILAGNRGRGSDAAGTIGNRESEKAVAEEAKVA